MWNAIIFRSFVVISSVVSVIRRHRPCHNSIHQNWRKEVFIHSLNRPNCILNAITFYSGLWFVHARVFVCVCVLERSTMKWDSFADIFHIFFFFLFFSVRLVFRASAIVWIWHNISFDLLRSASSSFSAVVLPPFVCPWTQWMKLHIQIHAIRPTIVSHINLILSSIEIHFIAFCATRFAQSQQMRMATFLCPLKQNSQMKIVFFFLLWFPAL